MPIYEYACEKCESEFEAEQRISDPPLKTCPRCRSRKVKRLISRTSFVLKGSGWYSDLYSSAKADKSGKSEKGDKADKGGDKSGDKGSAKPSSDAKPAKAPASKESSGASSGKPKAAA